MVQVTAVEAVVLYFIVGIDSLGLSACLRERDILINWGGAYELLKHMLIVDQPHHLVLGT